MDVARSTGKKDPFRQNKAALEQSLISKHLLTKLAKIHSRSAILRIESLFWDDTISTALCRRNNRVLARQENS